MFALLQQVLKDKQIYDMQDALEAPTGLAAEDALFLPHLKRDLEAEKRQIPYLPLDVASRLVGILGKEGIDKLLDLKDGKKSNSVKTDVPAKVEDGNHPTIGKDVQQVDDGIFNKVDNLHRQLLESQEVGGKLRKSALFILNNGRDIIYPFHSWLDISKWLGLEDKWLTIKDKLNLDGKQELPVDTTENGSDLKDKPDALQKRSEKQDGHSLETRSPFTIPFRPEYAGQSSGETAIIHNKPEDGGRV